MKKLNEDIFTDENYKIKTEWIECNNQYYLKLVYNNINYCFVIKLDFSNNWNISLIEQKDNIDYWYPIYLQKFNIKNKEEIMNYININFRKIIYDTKNKSISKKELLKAYNLQVLKLIK